jgi:hypothetical protein
MTTTRETWELASWIATTVGSVLAVIGVFVIVVQLYLQRKQARLDALSSIYAELDSHEARLAREFIYNTPQEHLSLAHLHSTGQEQNRKRVEETIATLERMAYRICTKQVPPQDAFNLYGGVLLSVGYRVWPYIQDQREMRRTSGVGHKLVYRRYLEKVIRQWVPKYTAAIGGSLTPRNATTQAMLAHVFGKVSESAQGPSA